jgi:lysophospholipase L1-like esterase
VTISRPKCGELYNQLTFENKSSQSASTETMAGKRLILNSVLFITSLVVGMGLGEVGLRLLGYAGAPESVIGNIHLVEDSVLNWRFVPNSVVRDGRITYRYNNAGFRDVDHSVAKRSDITRVLVLGDSVTEGSGVGQDQIFSHYVQNLLGARYEVINFGMSGLNTPQEIHLLEVEGLKYEPDVVALNFVLNDCDFYSELRAAERFQSEKDMKIGLLGDMTIDPRVKRLLKSSALIYFLKNRIEYMKGRMTGKEEKNYYAALWESPECRKRIASGFDHLHSLQKEYGFTVHVLLWPLVVDYAHYEFGNIHSWVMDLAKERGFYVLDLKSVYASKPYRELQVTAEDNVHPNGEGHRIAARAYVDWSRPLFTLHSR